MQLIQSLGSMSKQSAKQPYPQADKQSNPLADAIAAKQKKKKQNGQQSKAPQTNYLNDTV